MFYVWTFCVFLHMCSTGKNLKRALDSLELELHSCGCHPVSSQAWAWVLWIEANTFNRQAALPPQIPYS